MSANAKDWIEVGNEFLPKLEEKARLIRRVVNNLGFSELRSRLADIDDEIRSLEREREIVEQEIDEGKDIDDIKRSVDEIEHWRPDLAVWAREKIAASEPKP